MPGATNDAPAQAARVAAVIPCWNGLDWLPGLFASLDSQTRRFDRVVVVDSGSSDGGVEWLARERPEVQVLALGENRGFAAAANAGLAAVRGCELVALVNTDIELSAAWLARAEAALVPDPGRAAVATKLVSLADPSLIDDAGDVLRRDGVCEQRGRGRADGPRFDEAGEVFSACAGAALYRLAAITAVGGFDERFFSYLEDVDLGLRLRLAGWTCWYEPVPATHAGGGSSGQLARPVAGWVARNTLLLVAKAFPLAWAGPVLYRQLAWLVAAARGGRLRAHLGGLAAALPVLPSMWRERRALRRSASVAIGDAVPPLPWRGPGAGGHPRSPV